VTALPDTRRPAARAAVLLVLTEQTRDYPGSGHAPLTMGRDLLAYRTGLPRPVAALHADALAAAGAVTRFLERGRVRYYVPRES
jgi:hypothetical protein